MMQKCLYCGWEYEQTNVVYICENCGADMPTFDNGSTTNSIQEKKETPWGNPKTKIQIVDGY